MTLKLYGIKNCDTVKKTRNWLEQNGINYTFHDYRVDGLDLAMLEKFATTLSWEQMLNRRSTSWRQLSDAEKTDIDKNKAFKLMLTNPTLIKRPVLQTENKMLIGFSVPEYEALLLN